MTTIEIILFVVTFYFSVIVTLYDLKIFAYHLKNIQGIFNPDIMFLKYITLFLDISCYGYQTYFWFHYFNII